MEQPTLDGNAIAGPLHQHLGREMTTVRATCGHCGQTFVLAELVVYPRAPGSVGRCRHCESVVLVITEFRDTIRIHWNRFALAEPPTRSPAGAATSLTSVTSGIEHRVRVTLRWRDMDMLGHLNQSVYHELLEEGRGGLIAEIVRRLGGERVHGGYVVAHVDLDYHAEVRKDHGEVEVAVRLVHVGTSSLRLEHEVRLPDGTLAASGTSVLVGWDPATRGKRVLTDAERAALSLPR